MSPSSRNTAWQGRKELATARGVGVATQVFAARALNAHIWDVDGRRYIDFAGGIGRELGPWGLESFLGVKHVTVPGPAAGAAQ